MIFKKRTDTQFIILYRYHSTKRNAGRQEIDRAHRAAGGFGIGYHFVIRKDGTIEEGRDVEVVGSHHEEYNHNSIAICLIGSEPSSEQQLAFDGLVKMLTSKYPDALLLEDQGSSEP